MSVFLFAAGCLQGTERDDSKEVHIAADCPAAEISEEICDDGLDNDCDELIDSEDGDCGDDECPDICAAVCQGLPEPELPAGCPSPLCQCEESTPSECTLEELNCEDDLDDDCDGEIDSADEDCAV